jgi:N-acetylglucosaminyl-diphospho-decaprenol L-rhamnosyltransferase
VSVPTGESSFPDVDVVIVAHDAGDLLECAVASVEHQVAPGRVVVVDAGSTDCSVSALAVSHPAARIIPVANNGFAASNNVGIAATSGEFVLLLNPDAELDERALSPLVSRMLSTRPAAIVAPRVTDLDGGVQPGSYGRFPTLLGTVITRLGLPTDPAAARPAHGSADVTDAIPVDWVTGACMLVRRSAVETAGPLDERFFLYYEDVEWCHRMRDHGYAVLIEPGARCVHHRGGSGGDSPDAVKAYRDSFYRYCGLYHLWGLALAARLGLRMRTALGGRG